MLRRTFLLSCLVPAILLVAGCAATDRSRYALERKSLDELMALHMDDTALVDRGALYEVLRDRLQHADMRELFDLRAKANQSEPMFSDDFGDNSLIELIAEDSIALQVQMTCAEYDLNDFVDDILRRTMSEIDCTIIYDVVAQSSNAPDLKQVAYRSSGMVKNFPSFDYSRSQFIDLFRTWDGGILNERPFAGSYVHDGTASHIAGYDPINLNDAWAFIRAFYAQTSGEGLEREELQEWQRRLESDDMRQTRMALRVLSARPETSPDPARLFETIDRRCAQIAQTSGIPFDQNLWSLICAALRACAAWADDAAVQSALDFREGANRSYPQFSQMWDCMDSGIVTMAAAVPGPGRADRLARLLRRRLLHLDRATQALEDVPGEDIDALLLAIAERPQEFGVRAPSDLEAVWRVLGKRGVQSIRATLERVVEDPASADIGLPTTGIKPDGFESMRKSAMSALGVLALTYPVEQGLDLLLQLSRHGYYDAVRQAMALAGDCPAQLKPYLLQLDMKKAAYHLAHSNVGDRDFIPLLLQAAREKPGYSVLIALAKCGAEAEAKRIAVSQLSTPLPMDDEEAFDSALDLRQWVAAYLVRYPSPEATEVLAARLQARELEVLRDYIEAQKEDSSRDWRYRGLYEYRDYHLAALARCNPRVARPYLRAALRTGDYDGCFFAAWLLYALGDNTGASLLETYADHKSEYRGYAPLDAIRSPQTDDLLLRRLKGGLRYGDEKLLSAQSGFVDDYLEVVLDLLVRYVESNDVEGAYAANNGLARILTPTEYAMPLPGAGVERRAAVNEWKRLAAERLRVPPKSGSS